VLPLVKVNYTDDDDDDDIDDVFVTNKIIFWHVYPLLGNDYETNS
jgi:hypothetical protein